MTAWSTIATHFKSKPGLADADTSVWWRRRRWSGNCSHHPIDIQTQSDRVYVLKHRGPRKRTGGRRNPEARQKLGAPATAARRLPGTDPVGGGNTALWRRSVVGGSNAADRAIDNRHVSSGDRALDRGAAEQSVWHSGHRDPTDLSAGSQWSFRTRRRRLRKLLSAFRCAAGYRSILSSISRHCS